MSSKPITHSAELNFIETTNECMEKMDDESLIKYLVSLQKYDEALRLASLPQSTSINETWVVRNMIMTYLDKKHSKQAGDDPMEVEFEDAEFGF